MGFLSKLMKNPLVQMALPMALTGGASSLFSGAGLLGGSKLGLGLGSMFGKMNPMMANALKQSMLGYGTAALSGSKRPGKAAMYAGLASIPFSYMSAASAANRFNDPRNPYGATALAGREIPGRYEDVFNFNKPTDWTRPEWLKQSAAKKAGLEDFISKDAARGKGLWAQKAGDRYINMPWESYWKTPGANILEGRGGQSLEFMGNYPGKWAEKTQKWIKPTYESFGDPLGEVSAWDILSGKTTGRNIPQMVNAKGTELTEAYRQPLDANIFTKTTPVTDAAGNILDYETKANWLPTAASQAAAMYGGRDTPEEEWEKTKRRRKKELAWMYGVPEDMIEGEMTNPWNTGSWFNKGGITSLQNGGDVSGPGTGTSDSINANLSDGEFVMTAKAVENLGNGDRYAGARKMYNLMNVLDPESETMSEVV